MAGVRFSAGKEIFLFPTGSIPDLGPGQSLIQWIPGGLSPGVNWPEGEADHSSPSSAEIKNGGAIPPFPIYFHGVIFN
jgi:hypothetical protein